MTAVGGIKAAVKSAVATSTGWRLATRSRPAGCIVLLYHRIGRRGDPFPNLDVASFAAQVEWLTRNCRVIAPEALRDRARHAPSGRPEVVITFDDGYRDYHDLAYPVLKAHGVRAINFLSTAYLDDPALAGWWDTLHLAVRASTRVRVSLPWRHDAIALAGRGRERLLRAAKDYIKRQPNAERDALMRALVAALGVDAAALRVTRQMMTWEEVRQVRPFTMFGGHTHTHTIVSRLDPAELEDEIRMCRDRLQAETGVAPHSFAYPNGQAADFTDLAKTTLRRYGFSVAFSAIPALVDARTDWMAIPRLAGGRSVPDLAWRMAAMWRARGVRAA